MIANVLLLLGVLAVVCYTVCYNLWFSDLARHTRELSKINDLMERLNNTDDVEEIKRIKAQRDVIQWRYCVWEVEALDVFIKIKLSTH